MVVLILFKKRLVIKNLILFFLLIFPSTSFASITLNKSVYSVGEEIVTTTSGGPYVIYDLTSGNRMGGRGGYDAGESVDPGVTDGHSYSIIETTVDGVCEDQSLTYTQCKAIPEFVGEFLFSVGASVSPSSSSDSGSGSSGAIKSYRPEVEIFSPKFLQVSSSTVFIKWSATDLNDKDATTTREWLGLPDSPVTIFYSPDSDIRKRKIIAEKLPAVGSFSWDSVGLKDSDTYFIIISATDRVNDTGEAQVGPFTIDHSVPIFNIKTDPTQTRGEDVEITVESSKDLVGLPIVNVTQTNFIPTQIEMLGSKKIFKGKYKVVSGYDGPATISVSGVDNLNNLSSKISSGGEFIVGSIAQSKLATPEIKESLPAKKPETIIVKPKPVEPLSVKFLYPREGRGVGGVAEIVWSAGEGQSDRVKSVNLSYRQGDEPYRSIASQTTNPKILWDVRDLEEGKTYELKLEVSDGKSFFEVKRKVIVDNTAPTIEVKQNSPEASAETFILQATGRARDLLTGIDFVEYSLDGEHWFKADIKDGELKKDVNFSLKYPYTLEDGSSLVTYRAVDGAGNLSPSFKAKIVLDVNPPRIGSYTISNYKNNISLLPTEENKFEVVSNDPLKFKISMERDTSNATLHVGESEIKLTKGSDNLWTADLNLGKTGLFDIAISAEDGQGRKYKNKKIGKIEVGDRGRADPYAVISVFVLNEDEKRYVRWQAEEFGGLNPFIADENGSYSLLLPRGKYYLRVQKEGFERIRSEKFEVKIPSYINLDFNLTPLSGLRGFIEPIVDKLIFYEN